MTLQEQLLTEHKTKLAQDAKQQEDLAISRANNCYMIQDILQSLGFVDAEATLNGTNSHKVTATFLDHKFSINVCYDGTVRIQPPRSRRGTHGWADVKDDLSDLIPLLKSELAYALATGLTPNKEPK